MSQLTTDLEPVDVLRLRWPLARTDILSDKSPAFLAYLADPQLSTGRRGLVS